LSDPNGKGEWCYGHGRGMSQYGTYRWATNGKYWPWIVNHYYNANGGDDGPSSGERTAYILLSSPFFALQDHLFRTSFL